jgi:hypothetical protein
MMERYWKGILAGVGQVAALGTCLGTDAPEWLVLIIGAAGTLAVVFGPKNKDPEPA